VAGSVQLFIAALEPHSRLPPATLHHRCTGLVGAGEALSAAMIRGECSEAQAADALAALIRGGLAPGR
jgi:hypothetical protein